MIIFRSFIAAFFVVALVGPAGAATLTTPVLGAGSAFSFICEAVNIGTHPVTIKLEIINTGGFVVRTEECHNVAPGTNEGTSLGFCLAYAQVDISAGGFGHCYCKVTVASSKTVRASLRVQQTGFGVLPVGTTISSAEAK